MLTAAETIKNIRYALCLEQQELAEKLGITMAAVSNYERGKRMPRIPIIRKLRDLAKANGIELSLEVFLN